MSAVRDRPSKPFSTTRLSAALLVLVLAPPALLFFALDYYASYALPAPATRRSPEAEYIEFDPLQMWRLRPGFSHGGIAISAEGFRSSSPARPEGANLVFLIGGSAVFGVGMPEGKTITSFLQQLADSRAPDKRLRFINAGVTAYYSTQELIHLERNVLPHSPAVVISLTGRNDVFYGLHPNYKPDAIPYHGLIREQLGALDPYFSFLEEPPHRLHSVNWLRARLKSTPFDWLRDFDVPKLTYKTAATQVFLRNVRSMRAIAEAHGAEFHLFLQPTIRFPGRTIAAEEQTMLQDFYLGALDSGFAELARACSAGLSAGWFHGFATLPPGPGPRFIDNVHFNEEGARQVARVIYSRVFGPL
jgi:lysophospholipase L1-like esterase